MPARQYNVRLDDQTRTRLTKLAAALSITEAAVIRLGIAALARDFYLGPPPPRAIPTPLEKKL